MLSKVVKVLPYVKGNLARRFVEEPAEPQIYFFTLSSEGLPVHWCPVLTSTPSSGPIATQAEEDVLLKLFILCGFVGHRKIDSETLCE